MVGETFLIGDHKSDDYLDVYFSRRLKGKSE